MYRVLEQFKEKSVGLFYTSESDYPFEVGYIEDATPSLEEKLVQLAGKPRDTKVEKVPLEYFFRNMVNAGSEASPEQEETAGKFRELQSALQEELQDVAVYRIGTIEIDAFIIGKLKNGSGFGGLRTKVIET